MVQQNQAFCDFMCQKCAIQLDANFIAMHSERFPMWRLQLPTVVVSMSMRVVHIG